MHRLFPLLLLVLVAAPLHAGVLKIGTLHIEDAVPLFLAEREGFFREAGVPVELIPFQSALERDSALTAGAIDGAITDPVGALLLDQGRGLLRLTALCLGATPAEGPFAILAAPKSSLRTVDDLKGVEVAVSRATIIDYVTDRLLAERGFTPAERRTIDIKKMPIRLQMLLGSQVQAATLPEPLAAIAMGRGARRLLSDADSTTSLSQTVFVFRRKVLAERRAEVRAFFSAYGRAVRMINHEPEQFRPLFVDKGRIPADLATNYPIPAYPEPAPFPHELYAPVIDWLAERRLTPPLAYEQLVDRDFLARDE